MKLEIEHLAPYLPYNLKTVDDFKKERVIDWECQSYTNSIVGLNHVIHSQSVQVNFFKPILKPISDLSKLVIKEFEKYDGFRSGKADEEIINLFCEENGVHDFIENIELKSLPYECIEYMFRNHYDFFGLIEKGLAVDINTLNYE